MTQETRTWTLFGRSLTIQAPPETIARLEALLQTLQQQAEAFRKERPYADELTHFLMAMLTVLEALSDRLRRYEAFCERIEALLLPPQT